MDRLKILLYGNIYNEEFQDNSLGGLKCYNEMTVAFRSYIVLISTLCNALFICIAIVNIGGKIRCTIKQSKELNSMIGNKPNISEKVIGYLSFLTFVVQISYKFYTFRGILILNPCHIVILVQGILLIIQKTKLTAYIFVFYTRWLYGVYAALMFPDLEGLDIYFEPQMFYIEHYMGLIGAVTLIASGRYGFLEWRTLLHHQVFAFSTKTLYHRVILTPLSLLTWANLNFNLCRPKVDPFYPLVGQWYLLFAEYYLNLMSLMCFLLTMAIGRIIQVTLKSLSQIKQKLS